MQYRKDKYGNDISILGYGCMRFTQKAGKTDLDKAEKEVMAAYNAGVNYYDTAYIYVGNEVAVGEIFARNGIREKVNIATKLPHYLAKSIDAVEKMFQEELRRLQTTYIDYYLIHMMNDVKSWERLKTMGIEEWIKDKKDKGIIRQIGFSYHGNSDMFCQVIDCYDWDFCQIQYNYLDEHSQAGRKGLHYAASKGLPVIIMEPLRGGRLVNLLPEKAKKLIADYPVKRTPAEWGFRWLWNQPEVTCVLSGMNSMEMVEENIKNANTSAVGDFTNEDHELLAKVVKEITATTKVGCTGCGYCMPCPKKVDIPGTFAAYNASYAESKHGAFMDYLKCTVLRKDVTAASNCVGCGKCEQHCPQHIEIRKELKNASKELEGPIYKIVKKFAHLIIKY